MSAFTMQVGGEGTKTAELKRSVAAALSVVLSTRMYLVSSGTFEVRPSSHCLAAFCDINRQQHPVAILSGANSSGLRPIHFAAANNNTTLLQTLLQIFAEFPTQNRILVDSRDSNGNTAVHWAIQKGSLNAFVCLVRAGATLNVANFESKTPLHLAVALSDCAPDPDWCVNIVRLLLNYGANPNVGDQGGATPLHLASEIGNVAIIETLLDEGASVNAVDDEGETALFYALRGQHDAAIRKLFEYGINIHLRNSDGESARDFCVSLGDAAMSKLLESLQVQVEELPMLNPRSLSMELSESGLSASSGLWFSGNEVRSSF